MKLSGRQKQALEKITGRRWDSWQSRAIETFFAFTDKGWKVELTGEDKRDFDELVSCHRQHAIIAEMWKEDFGKGLLFLWDFLDGRYPESYVEHAFEIYLPVMGYIPTCYRIHSNCPKKFKL